jgi:cell division protein FtsW
MRLASTIMMTCVGALLALGMVMLYSSSMVQVGARYLIMQLVWCGLGLGVCLLAGGMDYRLLKRFHFPLILLGISVVLLVLVFVPGIGMKINGAHRWLNLGVARFQPSELAKVALIITLAWYGERYQRHMGAFGRGLLIPGALIALIVGLIFIEPDRGSAMLMAAVSGVLLLVAGVRWVFILPPLFLGLVGMAVSIVHDPMRMGRIVSWVNLEENKEGVGYQAWQAMLALGSGGWAGLGLGNGRQKLGFVPEHHTDFIFSIIGEELGLIATMSVIGAFVVLFLCGIYIAWNARDVFGQLLAAGLTFLIGLQAFINIGVVTSALPNKGISLPFISYGGSNLLMMLFSVGILFSIAREATGAADAPARERIPRGRQIFAPQLT